MARSKQIKSGRKAGISKKRSVQAAFDHASDQEEDDIFGASDDEVSDAQDTEQPIETAEEKRLRIGQWSLQLQSLCTLLKKFGEKLSDWVPELQHACSN